MGHGGRVAKRKVMPGSDSAGVPNHSTTGCFWNSYQEDDVVCTMRGCSLEGERGREEDGYNKPSY